MPLCLRSVQSSVSLRFWIVIRATRDRVFENIYLVWSPLRFLYLFAGVLWFVVCCTHTTLPDLLPLPPPFAWLKAGRWRRFLCDTDDCCVLIGLYQVHAFCSFMGSRHPPCTRRWSPAEAGISADTFWEARNRHHNYSEQSRSWSLIIADLCFCPAGLVNDMPDCGLIFNIFRCQNTSVHSVMFISTDLFADTPYCIQLGLNYNTMTVLLNVQKISGPDGHSSCSLPVFKPDTFNPIGAFRPREMVPCGRSQIILIIHCRVRNTKLSGLRFWQGKCRYKTVFSVISVFFIWYHIQSFGSIFWMICGLCAYATGVCMALT